MLDSDWSDKTFQGLLFLIMTFSIVMLINRPLIWISEASASFMSLASHCLVSYKCTWYHLALMDCIENEIGILQSYYNTVIVSVLSEWLPVVLLGAYKWYVCTLKGCLVLNCFVVLAQSHLLWTAALFMRALSCYNNRMDVHYPLLKVIYVLSTKMQGKGFFCFFSFINHQSKIWLNRNAVWRNTIASHLMFKGLTHYRRHWRSVWMDRNV